MVKDFNAKEFPNFLSQEEILKILDFAKMTKRWNIGGHPFWTGRVINASDIFYENHDIAKLLFNIKERIVEKIKIAYGINEIYPDLLQITRWFDGMEQPPHSDDMMNTDYHENHQHRSYGVVIYLNNDFDGGKTFYPQHNIEIYPEPGKMAVHPATIDHMHGVTKIEGGTRYTLTTFLTFDKTKSMPDMSR